MCNLYNITTSLEALRALTRAFRDVARWNEPSIDIYPNNLAPVIRVTPDGERELTMLKWGMPRRRGLTRRGDLPRRRLDSYCPWPHTFRRSTISAIGSDASLFCPASLILTCIP